MDIERCKGMRDLFPEDMEKFHYINDIFRDSCQKWGYDEVKTPTLEYLHLFTSAGTLTPSMLGKVYSFLDWDGWGGERVVLRPDATIPVARLYTEGMPEKELAKLSYIVNTFIFDETGRKNRERWQIGAELIGMGSPLADVELITLALEVLGRMQLKGVEVRLSHAGLTRSILQKFQLDQEEQQIILEKLLDGDTSIIAGIKEEAPQLASLLELQGKSSGFIKNLTSTLGLDLPELRPLIDDFAYIADTLNSLGIEYRIDIASARGFEYYTGVIFQLYLKDEKLGGGGRYDALIPSMGGRSTPASGFALYLDVLMKYIGAERLKSAQPKVLLKIEDGAYSRGFEVAETLRQAGFIVKLHLGGKGPSDVAWKLEVNGEMILTRLSD